MLLFSFQTDERNKNNALSAYLKYENRELGQIRTDEPVRVCPKFLQNHSEKSHL